MALNIILMADFNVHLVTPLLDCFNLAQNVNITTNLKGQILDFVLLASHHITSLLLNYPSQTIKICYLTTYHSVCSMFDLLCHTITLDNISHWYSSPFDLLHEAESSLLSILIFLDFSTPFDTIPNQLVVDHLASIGVCGAVYQWFASYLADSTQFVQIQNYQSESPTDNHGVPGSVLRSLLFITYLLPLGNIFWPYGIHFLMSYADYTQLYVSTKPTSSLLSFTLTTCHHDIQIWMTTTTTT